MLIDLHCHTKKVESSEDGRDIDKVAFKDTLTTAGVKIVAITNHNSFDLAQYNDFCEYCKDEIAIWPGVEIDVIGDKSGNKIRGHVIVVSNPKNVNSFNEALVGLNITDPEHFKIDIDTFVNVFPKGCLYIAHYRKTPELSLKDIDFLKSNIDDIILLEPSNLRKAGIVAFDDEQRCWLGSDVKDWNNYPSEKLPKCRFDFKNFDNLCFLLKKDRAAVLDGGYLDFKKSDLIKLSLFNDLNVDYQTFNDVNVLFGGKATAKTTILEELEKYYKSQSKKVSHYYVQQKEDELISLVNVKPSDDSINELSKFGCSEEIKELKEWKFGEVYGPDLYYKFQLSNEGRYINDHFKIIDASFSETLNIQDFKEKRIKYFNNLKRINEFIASDFIELLDEEDKKTLISLIEKIKSKLKTNYFTDAFKIYSLYLEKYSIGFLKNKISIGSSLFNKPTTVGFTDFFEKKNALINTVNLIFENCKKTIDVPKIKVGEVPLKGVVYRKTFLGIAPQKTSEFAQKTGGKRIYIYDQNQSSYNKFLTAIKKIKINDSPTENVSSVNELIEEIDNIKLTSLFEFANYTNFLVTDTKDDFNPSNGTTSVLLVSNAICNKEAEIFILDEPDSGMGEDYINSTLVKKINELAENGKKVFVATHDANLVVRLHPFSCLYREEVSEDVYKTFYGSSFDEYLINVNDSNDRYKFVDACIDKCEGGDDALTEREVTYGRN